MLWHADGTDIDQMMLALSTYMGHAEIFYTYWYLTAVPESDGLGRRQVRVLRQSTGRRQCVSNPRCHPHLPRSSKPTLPSI